MTLKVGSSGACATPFYKMAASSWASLINGSKIFNKLFCAQNVRVVSLLLTEHLPFRKYCTEVSPEEPTQLVVPDGDLLYKETPWKYLESEEYIEKYGSSPVWFGYRRNYKGQVPPQKTRKTCIRKDHICRNPCPICRDQKLFVDYRNVKLLEQFICPHTRVIYHPTQTGVCMRKHKELLRAIDQAQGLGLISVTVPLIDLRDSDWSNQHPAVSTTPASPALLNKTSWYHWYDWNEPPEKKIKLFRTIYKDYLKEESSP